MAPPGPDLAVLREHYAPILALLPAACRQLVAEAAARGLDERAAKEAARLRYLEDFLLPREQ
jgi:hypothetical protein